MWKSKWHDDDDEYYGYGNKPNAYQKMETRIDTKYLTEGWNNENNQGISYPYFKLVNWQLLVAPGLM